MNARTKIVATLGPATDRPEVLDELLLAGIDVVRLNLSHGPLDAHIARLRAVREAAACAGSVVAVLADLPGPKVRAAPFPRGGVELRAGATISLVTDAAVSSSDVIGVDYPTLIDDLHPGDRIVVGDGLITLQVGHVSADRAQCEVRSGGRAQGRPGVHLPSARFRMHSPTAQDLELAKAMSAEGADFLGVSFVRAAGDLQRVRDAVAPLSTRLVAKIETLPAIEHLDEIIAVSDAVMVARGDLGIECSLEEVPHMQKRIVRSCVAAGVPVITATQMLESMIHAPLPTRAEVSDVANAVFDGTDAVMLSGETAIGDDPAVVTATMSRIAERAEAEASYRQWAQRLGRMQRTRPSDLRQRITESITHAAWQAADDVEATAILCCTRTGRTARAMARYRPATRLVALSPDPSTLSALTLSWGVETLAMEESDSTDDMVWFAVERAVAAGLVRSGDTVVVIAGAPDRSSGAAADVVRIVRVQ